MPAEPASLWPPQPGPQLVVPEGDKWVPARQALKAARTALRALQEQAPQGNGDGIAELQEELRAAEQQLRRDEYVLDENLTELEQQREALGNVDRRLAAIEQDLRRNKDAKRLRQFGSMLPLHVTQGECPTCHQALQDTLLSQTIDVEPMSLDDNIGFIESQKATYIAMRQNTLRLVAAKEARFEAQNARIDNSRTNIRMLRQTLTGQRAPVEREIRQRLQLEESIENAEKTLAGFDERLQHFADLSKQWNTVVSAIKALPEDDLSTDDIAKLSALEKSLRQQLTEYRFRSLPPDSLSISRDTFRPEHEKFDFEVNNSASDLIRMIWAYVNGLLELSRSFATNHPGLLIMDEPKQQGAHRGDLGTFLRRLAAAGKHDQQVIITTSEEDDTFGQLIANLDCNVLDFDGKILRPLVSEA